MKCSYLKPLFLLILLLSSVSSYAATYIIGDSLSDPGAFGFTYTNPYPIVDYYNPSTRLPSGPIWTAQLADETLNCSALNISNKVASYISNSCNNFAVGGSGVLTNSTDFDPSVKGATRLEDQVTAILAKASGTENNTAIVWIGANDLIGIAKKNLSTKDNSAALIALEKSFNDAVIKLNSGSGFSKVLIIGIPDLQNTPFGQADKHLSNTLNNLSNDFNSFLLGFNNGIYKYVTTTGMYEVTPPVCLKISDPSHICGTPSNKVSNQVSNQDIVNFADPIHPSTALHSLIGSTIKRLGLL